MGVVEDAVVMRDDEHGTLRCHGGTGEQLHDGLARLVIECRGGLITNDKSRLMHECTSQSHTLLLAAGEEARLRRGLRADAETVE